MKTIVLGVGNKILGDDGVGVHVANELKKRVKNNDVVIDEAATGGLNLLDLILGYDKAIIVDAVKTKDGRNGDVKKIPFNEFSTVHSSNPHDVSFFEAIEMAKRMGEDRIPEKIIVIGVSMKENSYEFKERLSPKIAAAVPKACELVLDEIEGVGK